MQTEHNTPLTPAILQTIGDRIGSPVQSWNGLSENYTNRVYHIKTAQDDFVLKLNNHSSLAQIFDVEVRGLKLLEKANTIRVPQIFEQGTIDKDRFLLLEYIPSYSVLEKMPSDQFWERFGRQLAQLHLENTHDFFGEEQDGLLGKTPQYNQQTKDWPTFFIEQRLLPQIKLLKGQLPKKRIQQLELILKIIPKTLPKAIVPALLHGDLWHGNILFTKTSEELVLIDPAVYYGDREMDIVITLFYGGHPMPFYKSYSEAAPLFADWQDRFKLYELYYSLVQVTLFGLQRLKVLEHNLDYFFDKKNT